MTKKMKKKKKEYLKKLKKTLIKDENDKKMKTKISLDYQFGLLNL